MPKQEDTKHRDTTQILLPATAMTVAGIASFLSYLSLNNGQMESLHLVFLMVLTAFFFTSVLVLLIFWFVWRDPESDLEAGRREQW